jgi:hypothetical protein
MTNDDAAKTNPTAHELVVAQWAARPFVKKEEAEAGEKLSPAAMRRAIYRVASEILKDPERLEAAKMAYQIHTGIDRELRADTPESIAAFYREIEDGFRDYPDDDSPQR